MHSFTISIVLNLSILFAALTGAMRFKRVPGNYHPFIFIIWLGLTGELVSIATAYYNHSNAIDSNLFVLLEYGFIVFQFYKWNGGNAKQYAAIAVTGLIVWLTDNFIINAITENNSLFRVFYSLVIIVLSIDQVNKIIVYEKGPLIKNAMFIICCTFLFYYSCKAFVEAFNVVHLGLSYIFLWNLWIILYFVNAISNILYALAILCIPSKHEFTLPY